ncbi:MAG: hypothetical protein JOY72_07795 [Actinobacteria bacterium]|nr:hypothetical protein [Actinomycetota bacterium]
MSTMRSAVAHAGSRYRRLLGRPHPVQALEHEAEHLRQVEHAGESGETPFIAIIGIILFLLPIVVVFLGAAFAAYYLAR